MQHGSEQAENKKINIEDARKRDFQRDIPWEGNATTAGCRGFSSPFRFVFAELPAAAIPRPGSPIRNVELRA